MPSRLCVRSFTLFLALTAALAPQVSTAQDRRPRVFIDGIPDTGQFLPDTTTIATVGPRRVQIGRFIDAFFASNPEFRPRPDSLGRVKFLGNLIDKELLGQLALTAGRPVDFTDRAKLREYTQRVLSNMVFQRAIVDSVRISEDDIRALWQEFNYEQRFRHILIHDRATAERVRTAVDSGKLPWRQAVATYSKAKSDKSPDGDVGWIRRQSMDADIAMRVFHLKPGETSPVVIGRQGYEIIQAVERRPIEGPAYDGVRTMLRSQLQAYRSAERAEVIQDQLRREIGMQHDTANIAWASAQFEENLKVNQEALGTTFEVSGHVPQFLPVDTARVLARWKDGGRFTLRELLAAYDAVTPLMRPSINTPEAMRVQIDAQVLEPYMSQLAVRRGLDKDPVAVRLIENRREEIAVEHMFQDSVQSRVYVSRDERRKYYEERKSLYVTFPSVRYAMFVRKSRAGADSVLGRLNSGARVEDLVRADSMIAPGLSNIELRRQSDEGFEYQKLLFEELRPGKSTVLGPDKTGQFLVLHLIEYQPGDQLSFEQAEQYVDDTLQNIKGEAMLKALIERARKRYPVTSRPDLVMRIRLADTTLDQ